MYFVRDNPKDLACERHRIKIPTLGWVRIKEKGYIPTTKDGWKIKSGTVSIKAGFNFAIMNTKYVARNFDNKI